MEGGSEGPRLGVWHACSLPHCSSPASAALTLGNKIQTSSRQSPMKRTRAAGLFCPASNMVTEFDSGPRLGVPWGPTPWGEARMAVERK